MTLEQNRIDFIAAQHSHLNTPYGRWYFIGFVLKHLMHASDATQCSISRSSCFIVFLRPNIACNKNKIVTALKSASSFILRFAPNFDLIFEQKENHEKYC